MHISELVPYKSSFQVLSVSSGCIPSIQIGEPCYRGSALIISVSTNFEPLVFSTASYQSSTFAGRIICLTLHLSRSVWYFTTNLPWQILSAITSMWSRLYLNSATCWWCYLFVPVPLFVRTSTGYHPSCCYCTRPIVVKQDTHINHGHLLTPQSLGVISHEELNLLIC